jgi:hypothetical protein
VELEFSYGKRITGKRGVRHNEAKKGRGDAIERKKGLAILPLGRILKKKKEKTKMKWCPGRGGLLIKNGRRKRLIKMVKEKTIKISEEPKDKEVDYEKHLTERLGEDENYSMLVYRK